jgi:four helix bundle protein
MVDLKARTKEFAHRCVKMALSFPNNTLGWHLQKQLIRCSTSVAANYRAANVAQSKPSFVAKLSIVIEEVDESEFWIQFAVDEHLITEAKANKLLDEAQQLTAIFIASRKKLNNRSKD